MGDPHNRLVASLIARAGDGARLVHGSSRPWASVTFSGHVHFVNLSLPAAAADAFLDGLDEADFPLPGHLLADIALAGRRDGEGRALLELEALVLEAG